MKHKVSATNHLTFYRKVPGHPGHPRHGPPVDDIMDLMKKRNKNPSFSIGKYIHLRPLFIFPVRTFPVLLVAMLDERKKVGPRDFQPNTT